MFHIKIQKLNRSNFNVKSSKDVKNTLIKRKTTKMQKNTIFVLILNESRFEKCIKIARQYGKELRLFTYIPFARAEEYLECRKIVTNKTRPVAPFGILIVLIVGHSVAFQTKKLSVLCEQNNFPTWFRLGSRRWCVRFSGDLYSLRQLFGSRPFV